MVFFVPQKLPGEIYYDKTPKKCVSFVIAFWDFIARKNQLRVISKFERRFVLELCGEFVIASQLL
jgi:hypothetical protein